MRYIGLHYPASLFEYLANLVAERQDAWNATQAAEYRLAEIPQQFK